MGDGLAVADGAAGAVGGARQGAGLSRLVAYIDQQAGQPLWEGRMRDGSFATTSRLRMFYAAAVAASLLVLGAEPRFRLLR